MEITVQGNHITIDGNIKTPENYLTIKNTVQTIIDKGADSIVFSINNSLSMTSSVIGYLMKVVKVDKVHLSVYVGDERLMELMEELDLIDVFGVKRVKG